MRKKTQFSFLLTCTGFGFNFQSKKMVFSNTFVCRAQYSCQVLKKRVLERLGKDILGLPLSATHTRLPLTHVTATRLLCDERYDRHIPGPWLVRRRGRTHFPVTGATSPFISLVAAGEEQPPSVSKYTICLDVKKRWHPGPVPTFSSPGRFWMFLKLFSHWGDADLYPPCPKSKVNLAENLWMIIFNPVCLSWTFILHVC